MFLYSPGHVRDRLQTVQYVDTFNFVTNLSSIQSLCNPLIIMFRTVFKKEKVSEDLLEQAGELTQLPKQDLKRAIRKLLREDGNCGDIYTIFLRCKAEGMYHGRDKWLESFARLRCLVDITKVSAEWSLSGANPPGNVVHALERLMQESKITNMDGKRAILRVVLGCTLARAIQYSQGRASCVDMIEAARSDISEEAFIIARHAYSLLLEPETIQQICANEKLSTSDAPSLYRAAEKRGMAQANVAQIRAWKDILRDEVQDIIDKGYGNSLEDIKIEFLARKLMGMYSVDRVHAVSELKHHNGDITKAGQACMVHANMAEEQLKVDPVIPTRDTQSAPNVTPHTRIISVLGVDEPSYKSNIASPALGDGWMVSDFYLWMHVLDGLGKSQEWITSMTPEYLVEKYGRQDEFAKHQVDEDNPSIKKLVQTKWSSGFIHGDPFETRKVVLDDSLLLQAQEKVTIGPKGHDLRNYFLQRLESTMLGASESGDRILIMIFSHGDYDSPGGLYLGIDEMSDYEEDWLLKPSHMVSVFSNFPEVRITIYMTSCFSGHWVETTEFQGRNLEPAILAAANKQQESFGFAWSQSQRHAGGLFSSATLSELIKEPEVFLSGNDISREYRELTTALIAEMNRLCLPVNINARYGSSPVFTDTGSQEKFWRRTGYGLHRYKENYDKLPTAPPSDPHPKRNRKKFAAEFVDGNETDIVSWNARHPNIVDEDYPEATGGYGRTRRGLLSSLNMQYLVRKYLQSNPGSHTIEHKVLMHLIREFYDTSMNDDRKLHLRGLLISRLQMNKQANQDVKLLGLYRVRSIEEWGMAQTCEEYEYTTFINFFDRISSSGLYDSTPRSNGKKSRYYRKPAQYLAAAMALAGYHEAEVENGIGKLQQYRNGQKVLDPVTMDFMKSVRYNQSVTSIRSLVQSGRQKPQQKQRRPALSEFEWH